MRKFFTVSSSGAGSQILYEFCAHTTRSR